VLDGLIREYHGAAGSSVLQSVEARRHRRRPGSCANDPRVRQWAPRITGTGSPRSERHSEGLGNSPDQTRASHVESLSAIEVLAPYTDFVHPQVTSARERTLRSRGSLTERPVRPFRATAETRGANARRGESHARPEPGKDLSRVTT
jgi:hypothetical protein